jgi:hypothetical protein
MEEEQFKRIYSRLNQLTARSLADQTLNNIALGLIAVGTNDWRAVVDNVRLMAVSHIEDTTWDSSPEETLEIITTAREIVEEPSTSYTRRCWGGSRESRDFRTGSSSYSEDVTPSQRG